MVEPKLQEAAIHAYRVLVQYQPSRSAQYHAAEVLYNALRDAGVPKEAFSETVAG